MSNELLRLLDAQLCGRHPYAGGGLFNHIVINGRIEEPKARRFFQQIMTGIDYSHRLKIVYQEPNLKYMLLDDNLNMKFGDFGLSNEISDGDFLTTRCGSPNYAAPEVIRGGVYAGPEIDVWSRVLPFEDEEIQMLFAKINRKPAKDLITSMLVVDPLKRITVPEIIKHPFFTTNLPHYLTPLPTAGADYFYIGATNMGQRQRCPPPPEPVLGTLSALVGPPKQLDFTMIDGLGKIEEDVVEKLAELMDGVTVDDMWACLRRDDGAQGMPLRLLICCSEMRDDLGKIVRMIFLVTFAEAERDALLAAIDNLTMLSQQRNTLSHMKSPVGAIELEENPFQAEFNAEYESDPEDELDFMSPPPPPPPPPPMPIDPNEPPKFAVLNSSLPDQLPEQHHLASSTKWHFEIRSRSPPMEVILEIYRTLRTLGMEWKEKKNLGAERRNPEMDGSRGVDLKASIYFVETRAQVGDIVVLMNLQLYMVDSINYFVDFHHKKSYRASTEPGAGRFDMAGFDPIFTQQENEDDESMSDSGRSVKGDNLYLDEDDVVTPFVFMDVACKLILELAGASE
ncbi:hypothetical protein CPC08DRAFT_743028 [Agrocybe pediades]|nr:hypothetical protein CPC08DRAFT_743028 [Agrocybe pediades]